MTYQKNARQCVCQNSDGRTINDACQCAECGATYQPQGNRHSGVWNGNARSCQNSVAHCPQRYPRQDARAYHLPDLNAPILGWSVVMCGAEESQGSERGSEKGQEAWCWLGKRVVGRDP